MNKKEITRQEKFEDYRNSINRSDNELHNQIKEDKNKYKKNSLVEYFKENTRKKYIIYYSLLAISLVIVIILLVYLGINYL